MGQNTTTRQSAATRYETHPQKNELRECVRATFANVVLFFHRGSKEGVGKNEMAVVRNENQISDR